MGNTLISGSAMAVILGVALMIYLGLNFKTLPFNLLGGGFIFSVILIGGGLQFSKG